MIASALMFIIMDAPTTAIPFNIHILMSGLIDEFVDNIRNNKTPLINLKWHRRTIEAMNAVYESIEKGKPVFL